MAYDKEKVEKTALYVLIVSAVVAAFWFGLFGPGLNHISFLSKKSADLRERIDDAKDKIKNAARINERFATLEARMRSLEAQIPYISDTSWVVRLINDIEKELKFKTERIIPYVEQEKGDQAKGENDLYAFRNAQIVLKAGYHQIGQFVNTLEEKVKFVTIESITIEADKDNPFQHNVELKIRYPVLKKPIIE